MTETSGNNLKKWLPGAFVSLALGWAILRAVDLPRTLAAFRAADARFLLAAFFLNVLWLLVRGIVWRTLLRERASYRETFITLGEGYLMNNFLPFRLGELGRAFFLSRKSPLPFAEVLSTIVVERVFDLVISAGIFVAVAPFIVETGNAARAGYLVGGGVFIALLALYLLAKNETRAMDAFRALRQRIPKLGAVEDMTRAFLQGLSALADGALFFRFLGWMLFNWGIAIAQYFCIIAAFFPQATLKWGAFVLSAAAFGGAIPSLPGALGTLEAAIGGALQLLSGDFSTALAAALVIRFFNYLFSGAVGIYGFTREGKTLSGVYRELSAFKDRMPKRDDSGGL